MEYNKVREDIEDFRKVKEMFETFKAIKRDLGLPDTKLVNVQEMRHNLQKINLIK